MTKSSGKLSRKQKKSLKKREAPRKTLNKIEPESLSLQVEHVVDEASETSHAAAETYVSRSLFLEKYSLATKRGRKLALLLIALLCVLVYSNSLHSPFVFDDLHNFLNNPYTQITEISAENLWYSATRSPSGTRWLPNISFALNYYFGERDPVGYHLVNIGIHILTGFLVYLLALKTLALANINDRAKYRFEIAMAAAALWLLHPLQTNAVTYIVQRMTSMAALFCLCSLLLYIKARTENEGRRWLYYLSAAVSGFFAIISKENSYMLPVMIGAYEIYFLRARLELNFTMKKLGWAVALTGLMLGVAILLLGPETFSSVLNGYQTRDFTLGERLLTQTRVVVFYLALIFFPALSRLNLTHDFPVSTGLLTPLGTIPAILMLSVLLYLVFLMFNRNRLFSFALGWFFLNLLIESTIIPLELVYEHRVYLPSIFLFLASLIALYQYFSQRIYLVRCAVVAFIIGLAFITWQRNETWKDGMTFWNDVLEKSPNNARAYNNLAEVYTARNDFAKSLYYYQKALANKPPQNSLPIILKNLGFALIVHGRYDEAMQHLIRSVSLNSQDPKTHLNLGIVYKKKGNMGKANYHYGQARNIQANLFR